MTATPRLVAVAFAAAHSRDQYARMARVLAASARRHCPDWSIDVAFRRAAVPPTHVDAAYAANTAKLAHWADVVVAAAEGDRLLLADADVLVLRPLDDVWARPFDVAYTVRPAGGRFPLNAGVVFVRVSDRSRQFVRAWQAENARMLRDRLHHQGWRRQFGGLNQAALGALLHAGGVSGCALETLPCAEWNCEDSTWPAFDPAVTRILHVKSLLRRAIFRGAMHGPALRPLVHLWRESERAALLSEVSA
jgi:hypothetical protein